MVVGTPASSSFLAYANPSSKSMSFSANCTNAGGKPFNYSKEALKGVA